MLSAFTYSLEHEYVMSLNGLGLVLLPACVAEFALEFAHATTLTLASKIAQIKTSLFLFMDRTESEFIFNNSKYKAHPLTPPKSMPRAYFCKTPQNPTKYCCI